MTFRVRLLVASMLTIVVGLGSLLVTGNVLLAQRVRAEASSVLQANADSQVSALAVTATSVKVRATANDDVLDRRGWVFDGDSVIEQPEHRDRALDNQVLALGRARRVAEVDAPGDTRLRAEPVYAPGGSKPVGAVVVTYSLQALEHLQRSVLLGSLIIAALVLLAGGLAIRSAVNGALEPVARMTADAQSWGAHDLERRFDLGPARDELTGLAATLDGLLARIAASRRHEQRFAGDVAHELRTPLAALRARAELALGGGDPGANGDEQRAALESVVAQADRLSSAIETLLAVARQELDATEGMVDLTELAGELESATVHGGDDLPLAEGDPDVVRRAIAPLVDNARRHSSGPVRIELSASGGRVRLAVCDDGPGVAAEVGDQVFDPGVRGDDAHNGSGLGLPLARRLARSCGGDVTLGDGPGGRFVLELPAIGPQRD